jgi:hypothetical protein
MRLALGFLLTAALLAAAVTTATADEELFELSDGTVLRGYVMRESGDEMVIATSGFLGETRVSVEKQSIVKRHVLRADKARPPVVETAAAETGSAPRPESSIAPVRPADDWLANRELPTGDPGPESETFVGRFIRLSKLAVPDTPDAKATLAFFAIVVLVILVSWGARLADLPNPSLAQASTLAALFGAAFMADLEFSDQLLRSDRAIWVIPVQAVAWIGTARAILGGTVARAVLLFTFILCSLLAVLFVAGAVLVTV